MTTGDRPNVHALTHELIALQAERLQWLRQREIEAEVPLPEVTLALRVLQHYLDRAERLAKQDGSSLPTEEEYANILGSIQALDRPSPERPRSTLPSRTPTRADRRRAKRQAGAVKATAA